MVKNRIKVYARLKKEIRRNKELFHYEIDSGKDSDVVTIFTDESLKRGKQQFRFDKVFDTHCGQGELFDIIAKPVINGVLNGFNGTIFAYGPTGSGKTYSLTGSHRKYHRRGLIPRTIEYIFKSTPQGIQNHVIYISYLEIYNEIAYDLLNPKTNVSSLEELPRVVLLEDERGEAHFRNLSVRVVSSEEEAMRLLFLGDTNRTIAETPMNDYSSRSHCIFTVHVTTYGQDDSAIRKSKLNLVDLAGSERLHKIDLNGITLHEAKYINLSLHYLEQVILALSESRRTHVPFRNSIMTFMLRDSISGNCMTAMLATIGITRCAIEEAVTTCKFAQRVSMVKTNVILNGEINPRYEIENLKREIAELKQRLLLREEKEDLSKGEVEDCRRSVKNYLAGSGQLRLDDLRKIKVYVQLLKEEVRKKTRSEAQLADLERKYAEIIKQKDEEISLLLNIYSDKENIASSDAATIQGASEEAVAFNDFLSKPENQKGLQFYANLLNEKHRTAEEISNKLRGTQKRILKLRKGLGGSSCPESLNALLKTEQNAYKETLLELHNVQSEAEYLKRGMELQKEKILSEFKRWRQNQTRKCCLTTINSGIYENSVAKVAPLERDYNISVAPQADRGFNIHMKLSPRLHERNTRATSSTSLNSGEDNNAKIPNLLQASGDRGFNINVQLSPTIHERRADKLSSRSLENRDNNGKLSPTVEDSSISIDTRARCFYGNEKLSPRINEGCVVKVSRMPPDNCGFYGTLSPKNYGSPLLEDSSMAIDNRVGGFHGNFNPTINKSPVVKVSGMSINCGDRGFNGKLRPRSCEIQPLTEVSNMSLGSVERGYRFPVPQDISLDNRGYKIPVAQVSGLSLDNVDRGYKIPVAQVSGLSLHNVDGGYKIPAAQVSGLSLDRGYKIPAAQLPSRSQHSLDRGIPVAPSKSLTTSDRGFNINEKLDVLLRECEQVGDGFVVHKEFAGIDGYEEMFCVEKDTLKDLEEFKDCIDEYSQLQNQFDSGDSREFKEFLKTIPLTGDQDIDDEIIKFYRTTFRK